MSRSNVRVCSVGSSNVHPSARSSRRDQPWSSSNEAAVAGPCGETRRRCSAMKSSSLTLLVARGHVALHFRGPGSWQAPCWVACSNAAFCDPGRCVARSVQPRPLQLRCPPEDRRAWRCLLGVAARVVAALSSRLADVTELVGSARTFMAQSLNGRPNVSVKGLIHLPAAWNLSCCRSLFSFLSSVRRRHGFCESGGEGPPSNNVTIYDDNETYATITNNTVENSDSGHTVHCTFRLG